MAWACYGRHVVANEAIHDLNARRRIRRVLGEVAEQFAGQFAGSPTKGA